MTRTQAQAEEDYLDSTVHIQRLVRGHLGRLKMKARRVELKLNKRVRKMAYEYISKGGFWEFLSAVNQDYERYNEQRSREEELAATFINQVLVHREKQQEEAWKSWNAAKEASTARGQAAMSRSRQRVTATYLSDLSSDQQSRFLKSAVSDAERKFGKLKVKGRRSRKRPSGSSAHGMYGMASLQQGSAIPSMSPVRMLMPTTSGSSAMANSSSSHWNENGEGVLWSTLDSIGPRDTIAEHSSISSDIVIGGISVPAGNRIGNISISRPFQIAEGQGATENGHGQGSRLLEEASRFEPVTSGVRQESSIVHGSVDQSLDYDKFPDLR